MAVPKYEDRVVSEGLLMPETFHVNLLDDFLAGAVLVSGSGFTHGDNRGPEKKIKAPFSEKYYALKYGGSPLDLFVVIPPAVRDGWVEEWNLL